MIVELSLSYFTSPLKINPAISDEDESVARIGFSLDGFADVARCRVDAWICTKKSSRINRKEKKNFNYFISCPLTLSLESFSFISYIMIPSFCFEKF